MAICACRAARLKYLFPRFSIAVAYGNGFVCRGVDQFESGRHSIRRAPCVERTCAQAPGETSGSRVFERRLAAMGPHAAPEGRVATYRDPELRSAGAPPSGHIFIPLRSRAALPLFSLDTCRQLPESLSFPLVALFLGRPGETDEKRPRLPVQSAPGPFNALIAKVVLRGVQVARRLLVPKACRRRGASIRTCERSGSCRVHERCWEVQLVVFASVAQLDRASAF